LYTKGIDFKGSEVRNLHEPVTVMADNPARYHWETGKVRGRKKPKSGNLGRKWIVLRGVSQKL
jgi:hypothetical protein